MTPSWPPDVAVRGAHIEVPDYNEAPPERRKIKGRRSLAAAGDACGGRCFSKELGSASCSGRRPHETRAASRIESGNIPPKSRVPSYSALQRRTQGLDLVPTVC